LFLFIVASLPSLSCSSPGTVARPARVLVFCNTAAAAECVLLSLAAATAPAAGTGSVTAAANTGTTGTTTAGAGSTNAGLGKGALSKGKVNERTNDGADEEMLDRRALSVGCHKNVPQLNRAFNLLQFQQGSVNGTVATPPNQDRTCINVILCLSHHSLSSCDSFLRTPLLCFVAFFISIFIHRLGFFFCLCSVGQH
jgi:hypothetical protein